mgnify:CR=1 FL=1
MNVHGILTNDKERKIYVIDLLKKVGLEEDHFNKYPHEFSGGQRQRIGIARALYNSPKLLILDEATSSLDNLTENTVMDAINNLGNDITIIIIAHRLSTVRNADSVIYMDKGKVIAIGRFEEVRAKVPDFDRQAKLMGL